jgi:hypothetical protein
LQISPTFLTSHTSHTSHTAHPAHPAHTAHTAQSALILASEDDATDGETDHEADIDEETGERLPLAWIMNFPPSPYPHNPRRTPEIALRSLSAAYQRDTEMEIACLLGFWRHEHQRLIDPDAPGGMIVLPREPGVVSLLHQYAIALLLLPRDCPPSSACRCNQIRARFNAPPPGHENPTGVFTVEDLEREAQRPRTDTEPRFPYRDMNPWTE